MSQPRQQIPDGGVRPGYNGSGSTIAKKLFVQTNGSTADQIRLPNAITDKNMIGVTLADIADGKRGDIQTRGLAIGTSAAAVTRGAALEVTTAGKVQTLNTGTKVGVANTTTTAADQDIEIDLQIN